MSGTRFGYIGRFASSSGSKCELWEDSAASPQLEILVVEPSQAASTPADAISVVTMVERIVIKWQGKELAIPVSEDDTVQSLKRKIQDETNVQPQRQKLLGLKRRAGGMPGLEDPVSGLLLKDGQKIMMMGCASYSSHMSCCEQVWEQQHRTAATQSAMRLCYA